MIESGVVLVNVDVVNYKTLIVLYYAWALYFSSSYSFLRASRISNVRLQMLCDFAIILCYFFSTFQHSDSPRHYDRLGIVESANISSEHHYFQYRWQLRELQFGVVHFTEEGTALKIRYICTYMPSKHRIDLIMSFRHSSGNQCCLPKYLPRFTTSKCCVNY